MTPAPTTTQQITLLEALLPLITLAALLIACATFLELNGELLVLVILASAAVAGWIAKVHGATWDDIQRVTGERFASVLPVILILLAIGMLIGSWVMSGTIPFIVFWGIRIVRPEWLALTAFLATATMSLCTGTSWGSAGTIGVALMGMATALHAPLPMLAGAVVSGAYFGDKMSPLSDSTNICAIGAGVPLYRSIRHLLYTAIPSFTACVIVYSLASRLSPVSGDGLPASARILLGELDGTFRLSWITLIPLAVVLWGILRKYPPALAITLSAAVAVIVAIALQGVTPIDALTSAVAGARVDMIHAWVAGATPSKGYVTLVQRGGLYSMAPTLVVIIAAFMLAAAMDLSGALRLLIDRMLAAVTSVFRLIAATMAAGATMIALTSHGGVTALVIGGLFQPAYKERLLAPENLSRSLDDSVTITEPLMPWTVSAIFMATTLGVPTAQYAPWAVFCYGGPIFSLTIAALYRFTGFGIKRLNPEEEIVK
ncbi:MAG TPA: Na+/H+ antiporter NhaC [Gemmatimonadaceae bacterium]|nr:Na+/H+ antiporter NhaC [Gemmatimonadaceae bacterium]